MSIQVICPGRRVPYLNKRFSFLVTGMMDQSSWLAVVLGAFATLIIDNFLRARNPLYKPFPGPRGLPLVGNLFSIPSVRPWETYARWKDIYGDFFSLKVPGSHLLVLNNFDDCIELLEKRSSLYSDRPYQVMLSSLMGWVDSVVLIPYSDRWRRYRRMMAQSMRKGTHERFWSIQEKVTQKYLVDLLKNPEKYLDDLRIATGRGIMYSVYGIEVEDSTDPCIAVAEEAIEAAAYAAIPGRFLVDLLPFVRYFPSWFPGAANWHKFAENARVKTKLMLDLPLDIVKRGSADDNIRTFVSELLGSKGTQYDEDAVRWCAGTMYAAGLDTTTASITSFFLSMCYYPEVQKRAQREIDAVIGSYRLPTFSDRDSLPYVNALIKEVTRWQPVSPIALPHRLISDDVWKGHFIPEGTLIIPNVYAIARSSTYYDQPDEFIPERFLPLFDPRAKKDAEKMPLDPQLFTFGFGRRICGGMHYADSMLYIVIANILATFNIECLQDENGKDMLPPMSFNDGSVRCVDRFKCKITPRSEEAKSLIAQQAL